MPRGESRLFKRQVELDPGRQLRLTLIEDPTIDVGGDDAWCAWCLWPGAKVLTEYLATLDDAELAGRSVLELGSGCGAVGMYLAQRHASPVLLTDVYRALPLLKRNIKANSLPCDALPLPWGTPLERLAPDIKRRVPFDLVVASECSYDFKSPDVPSASLDNLLSTAQLGTRALICVGCRPNEVEAFDATLRRHGLQPEVVHRGTDSDLECLVYSFNFSAEEPGAEEVPTCTTHNS